MAKSLKHFVDEALKIVREISPEEVHTMLGRAGRDYMLLDVREPDEFAAGHLPGAINIPRGFLEVRADHDHYKRDERLQDRSKRIICYCGGGHRSALAAKTLLEMGFKDASSMAEGWTGWTERGLPTTEES